MIHSDKRFSWVSLPERVARLACDALLEEPAVFPRFGLVGPEDTGAHADMDIRHFEASAAALSPYFADLVRLGLSPSLPPHAKASLARRLGIRAEAQMLDATGGRNTHKGAIFLLGVFVVSWAMLLGRDARGIRIGAALQMATRAFGPELAEELPKIRASESYGAWAYLRHGKAGARGLLLQGFAPLLRVFHDITALEAAGIADPMRRLGHARLLSVALVDDTNLLKRGGLAIRERLRAEAHALWRRGGALDPRNDRDIARLDAHVARRGLSASASGDTTAAILLFQKMCHEGLAIA